MDISIDLSEALKARKQTPNPNQLGFDFSAPAPAPVHTGESPAARGLHLETVQVGGAHPHQGHRWMSTEAAAPAPKSAMSFDTPPAGFTPAKHSAMGGHTDGKGNYWYPGESRPTAAGASWNEQHNSDANRDFNLTRAEHHEAQAKHHEGKAGDSWEHRKAEIAHRVAAEYYRRMGDKPGIAAYQRDAEDASAAASAAPAQGPKDAATYDPSWSSDGVKFSGQEAATKAFQDAPVGSRMVDFTSTGLSFQKQADGTWWNRLGSVKVLGKKGTTYTADTLALVFAHRPLQIIHPPTPRDQPAQTEAPGGAKREAPTATPPAQGPKVDPKIASSAKVGDKVTINTGSTAVTYTRTHSGWNEFGDAKDKRHANIDDSHMAKLMGQYAGTHTPAAPAPPTGSALTEQQASDLSHFGKYRAHTETHPSGLEIRVHHKPANTAGFSWSVHNPAPEGSRRVPAISTSGAPSHTLDAALKKARRSADDIHANRTRQATPPEQQATNPPPASPQHGDLVRLQRTDRDAGTEHIVGRLVTKLHGYDVAPMVRAAGQDYHAVEPDEITPSTHKDHIAYLTAARAAVVGTRDTHKRQAAEMRQSTHWLGGGTGAAPPAMAQEFARNGSTAGKRYNSNAAAAQHNPAIQKSRERLKEIDEELRASRSAIRPTSGT